MDILIIAIFLSLGIIAMLLEMFLVPGISIAGIAGVIFIAMGIVYGFNISPEYGYYAITFSAVTLGFAIYYFMKSKTLEKLSLHAEIDGKVDPMKDYEIKIGDKGITVSRLAPMGKVKINNHVMEAKSESDFLDEGVEIEVIEINRTNVNVKIVL